jgi:hypothetical protein
MTRPAKLVRVHARASGGVGGGERQAGGGDVGEQRGNKGIGQ